MIIQTRTYLHVYKKIYFSPDATLCLVTEMCYNSTTIVHTNDPRFKSDLSIDSPHDFTLALYILCAYELWRLDTLPRLPFDICTVAGKMREQFCSCLPGPAEQLVDVW